MIFYHTFAYGEFQIERVVQINIASISRPKESFQAKQFHTKQILKIITSLLLND